MARGADAPARGRQRRGLAEIRTGKARTAASRCVNEIDLGGSMSTTVARTDFKVADLGLAEYGRNEIRLAEHEMPGLMATRREFSDAPPLAGARITGALHMTVQLGGLI